MDELTTGELLIMRTTLYHVNNTEEIGPFAPLFKSLRDKINKELDKRPDKDSETTKQIFMIHNKLN